MGSANQSFQGFPGDIQDRALVDELKRLVDQPHSTLSEDDRAGLEQAFREAVNNAIFGDQADAVLKQNVANAVQARVKQDILVKYEAWKRAGENATAWPFRKRT